MGKTPRNYGASEISPTLWQNAWQDRKIARQQAELVQQEFENWAAGEPHKAFDAFESLLTLCKPRDYLLEIGCGAGVYAAVCHKIDALTSYHGVDSSEHMINAATGCFGDLGVFTHADGECLEKLADNSFDVVVLGSVLGHTADWEKMLAEALRVSDQFIILHRVGCYHNRDKRTMESTKRAYGVEMAERFFDEQFLIESCKPAELVMAANWKHADIGHQGSFLLELEK